MTRSAGATLLSVNVGLPRRVAWNGTTVFTGIFKVPVPGPRKVRRLNIDGDGQGDLGGHGGEQRAVLVYQRDSYDHWARHFGRDDLTPGSFGENFTVDGLADDEVCIGDRYRIGTAEFEVTQPRVTCFRVGMRLGEPQLPALLVGHRRPGFYLRVITEGEVGAGDPIVRTRTGRHRLTVAATDALLYLPGRDADTLRKAVDIPALSPGWQQSFRDLLTGDLSTATTLGPTIGTEPAWDGFRAMTVARVVRETPTVSSFHLRADGDGAEPALPGQYLTLRLRDRAEDAATIRSYSISAQPSAGTYRITVRRDERGRGSRFLHDNVRAGSSVDVAAPRGEFVLRQSGEPVVLASAGVGATPLMAMLHELADGGSTGPVWWVHVARGPEDHLFAAEAGDLLDRLPGARRVTFYTRSTAVPATGTTLHGRPDGERLALLGLPATARAYLCGPGSFVADLTTTLVRLGLAPDRIHSELFGALAPINPGVVDRPVEAPHQPAEPGTGPAVTFARSGLTTRWRDGDRSLLDLAEACAIPTRWSCRTGVCHTCATPVISGTPTYGPEPLEPPPPGQVLLCCAQPVDDLVVDA
ncbi:MOSC domain-containing protein [Jiangella mangrovi]|uniref:Ferredoxin-NADP reductase/MOSC domain-containing protein YiiM n=1 Tax=Jiangella mangrovi TaxID=1524084 RepID=A0A7W9GRQ9_9ACTN|nr:MOSC domain-containing protein [Jiangella mangrovi]MBB5788544.1 ferredoxin-NADP reductase/MOSC domain-containing protein YiiM [Jiangella mangrovi]